MIEETLKNNLMPPAQALPRPQPMGIYALPAGYLLLPKGDATVLAQLMAGNSAIDLPETWRFFGLALQGKIDEAHDAVVGHDAIGLYNRFVLRSDPATYSRLKAQFTSALAALLDVVAFTLGYIQQPPKADEALVDGELRAVVLMSQAAAAIEHEQPQQAMAFLQDGALAARATSPIFAAQLLNTLASLRRSTPGQVVALAVQNYQDALKLAGETPLPGLRAELWLNLGMTYHELANGQRGALLEASKCYQEALRAGLTLEDSAEMYALAHNNLALAYLAMPMVEASDQLRMGIAVQSLREALKVYRQDTHPELWASAQLNLANALQYLPSAHPQDNLIQAVEIYESLLAVRNKAYDPVGYARLLNNQANALAHLGIFAPALDKLDEAHKLFHWHGEPELAAKVLDQVEAINVKIAERGESEKGS